MVLPPAVRPALNSLFNSLLTSIADSTVKKKISQGNKQVFTVV